MKKISTLLLVATAFLFTSCSNPQKHSILGVWHEVGTAGLVAFHEDGTVEITADGKEVSGKYSFITESKLKIELMGKGASIGPRIYQIMLEDAKMMLTEADGQKTEYLKAQ